MKLSADELRTGAMSAKSLRMAVRTLRESGFLAIEAILPHDWVSHTRQVCNEALLRYMETLDTQKREAMQRVHTAMFPPICSPFMDAAAIENPFAVQVAEATIGHDFFCTFYNTNTQWPHSGIQHLHRDFDHLFAGFPVPLPVIQIIVNIPLVDFTLENGATEVWPGSHLIVDERPEDGKALDQRAACLPSVRTTVPAGSIILRDMRTWHRGMPNRTSEIRTMLAMIYNRAFLNPYISATELIEIPRHTWKQLSPRARQIFRHNPIVDKEPSLDGKAPPY
ncbi:MAG: phytanoyl-CoA dioxygenase family protein [Candidatus Acidiferrales bacterium]